MESRNSLLLAVIDFRLFGVKLRELETRNCWEIANQERDI